METVHALESQVVYAKRLMQAGWDGIASARHEGNGTVFRSSSKLAVLTPTAIGAALGVLGTRHVANRRSRSSMAAGGLIGSALGLGAAIAWASRRFTGIAVRSSVRQVNRVRDLHWLDQHPITYA